MNKYNCPRIFTSGFIFDKIIDISAKNGRILNRMATSPITFTKQAVDELKKVTWPTRDEVIRLTVAVLVISTVVGLFLGGIDFVLTKTLEILLNR